MKIGYQLTCLILAFFLSIPSVNAGQAGIVLLPTRIVLGPKERNITVMVKNNGNATGEYRVELVDMIMPESGTLKELPSGDAYSAKPMLRISPRQMVLKPEESQNIRILVRKPRNLEDGEYRTHLRIKLVEDNVDAVEASDMQHDNLMIQVKPRFSLVIPVIFRHGKTTAHVALQHLALENKSTPLLHMVLVRSGNSSVIGDVDVEYKTPAGKLLRLQYFSGVAVYRPTPRRQVAIPLILPKGLSLQGGSLHVLYKTQDKDNAAVMAEGWLPL